VKVYVLPADSHGCGHYRLVWPSNILQQRGHDVVVMPPNMKGGGFEAKSVRTPQGEMLTSVRIPEDADAIVIQRPAHPLQPQMINILRQNGVAVIVDMDDDMSTIHPHNSAFTMYRENSSTPFSHKWAIESCKAASLVTCTTPALLKRYAPHGRGVILDNYVPGGYLGLPCPITEAFGWAGTVASHPNDLQIASGGVQRLLENGYRFAGVGDPKGVKSALRLREEPYFTGTVKLIQWAETISATMDVGIIPLAPTSFNTAKSRLKGIEMSAVGVPWVASPRDEYRRLAKESGGGLLADSPKEWFSQVKRLMDDHNLRQDLAAAGREYMKTQTYEANAWRWWEAWERAVQMERSPGSLSSPLAATAQTSLTSA
jgi:hypothetical protein